MSSTIALLTDFGLEDSYVGVMKGVMLGVCPAAHFVDLTHAIRPQDVRQGALALADSYGYFPAETVFLSVVDPGVGGERRAISVRAGHYTFVAPDNGLLSYVLRELEPWQAVELSERQYWLAQTSGTFHGRDVFAPVAAHLASGVQIARLGEPVADPVMLAPPCLIVSGERISGEVVDVDHYGTLITSIGTFQPAVSSSLTLAPRFDPTAAPITFAASVASVVAGSETIVGVRRTFGDVVPGELVALVGSRGQLEIAVNQGSAMQRLGLSIGDPVEMRLPPPTGA